MRNNWRDCKEWINCGMPLTTTSDSVCKLYDASVSQLINFYNEPQFGGLEKTVHAMLEEDPNFVMGHIIASSFLINSASKTMRRDQEVKDAVQRMVDLANKQGVTDREKKHVQAMVSMAKGDRSGAVNHYRDILTDFPLDIHAAHEMFMACVFLGYEEATRDEMSFILPHYTPETPGYWNILSYRAFGLEETNYFSEAEKDCLKCLEIDQGHAWASHTLAHIYIGVGKPQKGLDFMKNNESYWNNRELMSCHNYWHTALFEIEKGNYDEALGIFDKEIGRMAVQSKMGFQFSDASSLLCRLQLEGCDVGNRWDDIMTICDTFIGTHNTIFIDAHNIFTCYKSGNKEKGKKLIESLKEYARECTGDNPKNTWDVGIPLCEGIAAYEDGEFEKATDILVPLRYKIPRIGGSNAQRDVFQQFMIHAAMRSPNERHQKLARSLLTQRKLKKEDDPQTDRLMAQLLDAHAH